MKPEKDLTIKGQTAYVVYTFLLSWNESVSSLIRNFTQIAKENGLEVDDLYFSACSVVGYGGDENVHLTVSLTRIATLEERQTHLEKEEQKKQNEKIRAKQEIERLQKLIEE